MPEFNDAAEPDKKVEKKSAKMKTTTTKGDAIDKGRTITGSKPDTININPVLEKAFSEIESIYDTIMDEDIDRKDTHKRDEGTTSLKNIYRHDTPGQGLENKNDFELKFKNPKRDKEAVLRSGKSIKNLDFTPRMDPKKDRHTGSDFYRQQSFVKKVIEAKNPFKKSSWEKMLDKNPKHAESERRAQDAKAGLKKASDDYQSILDKESKKNIDEAFSDSMNEISHTLIHSFASHMLAKHPEAISPLKAKTKKDKLRANALQLAMDKDIPKSAIHRPHVVATEETVNEISNQLIGKVNKLRNLGPDIAKGTPAKPHKSQAAADVLSRAVDKARGLIKAKEYTYPELDEKDQGEGLVGHLSGNRKNKKNITPLHMSPSTNPGLEESKEDPIEQLRKKLLTMKDTSYSEIDRVMLKISDDAGIQSDKLHKDWVKKYGVTPDTWIVKQNVSEDLRDMFESKQHGLFKYNKRSGMWDHQRSVSPETKDQYIDIFQKDEPNEHFVVSKNRPKHNPLKEDIDSMFEEFSGCFLDVESDVLGIVEENFVSSGNEIYEDWGEIHEEADHQGKKVRLGKPFLTPGGPKKRAVYVKNGSGNVVKVNFGDPHLSIKRDQPTRRASYRARHHCENPGPRWKANYWSCKYWSSTPTSKLDRGATNEALVIHDATGKEVKIKKQKVREIDGKIHMEYPGKSRSSER